MTDVVSELLACPACGTSYGDTRATRTADALVCGACTHRVPIVRGIPRFADTPDTDEARRTQASFGYEWTHFNDWQPSGQTNFNDYFAGFDLSSLAGKVDTIIALTHLSLAGDTALVNAVPEIDLVLGGHEHENWALQRGPHFTPIIKADANVRSLMAMKASVGMPGTRRIAPSAARSTPATRNSRNSSTS